MELLRCESLIVAFIFLTSSENSFCSRANCLLIRVSPINIRGRESLAVLKLARLCKKNQREMLNYANHFKEKL